MQEITNFINPPLSDLDAKISALSFNIVILATALLLILVVIAILKHKPSNLLKKSLFILISAITILTTLFLAGSTIYLNNVSSSKGPVHWHADIEIWACGNELDLKNPTGWSNKIGTATLHEHNDKRIHLEGVVVEEKDASLGKFFQVIGGEITPTSLKIPTTEGVKIYQPQTTCPNSNDSKLQVFVYKVMGKQIIQSKVSDPASYIISPESQVPSGDCIIIEYGAEKEKTDHLCRSFIVQKELDKIE